MVFELFNNYASVEYFQNENENDNENDNDNENTNVNVVNDDNDYENENANENENKNENEDANENENANANENDNENANEDEAITINLDSVKPASACDAKLSKIRKLLDEEEEAANNEEEEGSTEDAGVEGFQGNVFDEDEEFSLKVGKNLINLDLLLRSLLYASLFYILAHPDTYQGLIRRVFRRASKTQGLYVSMALFFVAYYVLNLFI